MKILRFRDLKCEIDGPINELYLCVNKHDHEITDQTFEVVGGDNKFVLNVINIEDGGFYSLSVNDRSLAVDANALIGLRDVLLQLFPL